MVDRINVQKIIDLLKNEENCFNMQDFMFNDYTQIAKGETKVGACGTPACIGGWVMYARNQEVTTGSHTWLGITEVQEDYLYCPNNGLKSDVSYKDITRKQAIKTLENLRDTGIVDWSHIIEEKE